MVSLAQLWVYLTILTGRVETDYDMIFNLLSAEIHDLGVMVSFTLALLAVGHDYFYQICKSSLTILLMDLRRLSL